MVCCVGAQLLEMKQKEIEKIDEKNKRIADILVELKQAEEIPKLTVRLSLSTRTPRTCARARAHTHTHARTHAHTHTHTHTHTAFPSPLPADLG